jgi:hypothetical protein
MTKVKAALAVALACVVAGCTPMKKPAPTSAATTAKAPVLTASRAPLAAEDIRWEKWAPVGSDAAKVDWPAGAAWCRGKLYVVGSRKETPPPGREALRPATMVFYEIGPGGGREAAAYPITLGERANAALTVGSDNQLWLVGGYYTPPPIKTVPEGQLDFAPLGTPWGEVNAWKPGDAQLRVETTLPVPRGDAGVCFGGGKLFVVGGAFDKAAPTDDKNKQMHSYNPQDGLWTKFHDLKNGVLTPAVAVAQNGLFIMGGKQPVPSHLTNLVLRYDLLVFKWQRLESLPAPRAGAGAFVRGDYIYVLGGRETEGHATPGRMAATSFRLHLKKKTWEELPTPLPEGSTLVAFDGDNFYLVGAAATYRGRVIPRK